MCKLRQRRPVVECLENRVQLSTTWQFDYPWNTVGPLPTGSYRDTSPGMLAQLAQDKAEADAATSAAKVRSGPRTGITPQVFATGIQFTFPGSWGVPIPGNNFGAQLALNPTGPGIISSTTWTMQIAYIDNYPGSPTNGDTITSNSATIAIGPATNTTIMGTQPGTYTVTATTTYTQSSPSALPVPPTVVTGSITLLNPDGVTKGGNLIGVPVPAPGTIIVADQVTAAGFPVGPQLGGLAQESVNGAAWYPPAQTTGSFQMISGKIQDQMGPDPLFGGASFAAAPISTTTPYWTWTQVIRLAWGMTGTVTAPGGQALGAGNFPLYSNLGTLNWAWYKMSANTFEVQ